jgi:hypothetical protein
MALLLMGIGHSEWRINKACLAKIQVSDTFCPADLFGATTLLFGFLNQAMLKFLK